MESHSAIRTHYGGLLAGQRHACSVKTSFADGTDHRQIAASAIELRAQATNPQIASPSVALVRCAPTDIVHLFSRLLNYPKSFYQTDRRFGISVTEFYPVIAKSWLVGHSTRFMRV